jgi:DNA-binding transcriptional LysR family regulator
MIEMRQLRHFVAVVELGNFSAAAEHVFVSQSALTRSIQHLEQELGAVLLTRGARRTIPTAAGDRLLSMARMILQDCADAVAEVRVIQAGQVGEVAFGFDPIFAFQFLDTALVRLAGDAPGVTTTAIAAPLDLLLQRVRDGHLDFALACVAGAFPAQDLVFEPILEIEDVVVAGRRHRLARQRTVRPEELARERWVVLDEPLWRDDYARLFASLGVTAPQPVHTNSLTLIRDEVNNGRFLSILPEPLMRRELRHRLAVRLPVEVPPRPRSQRAGFVQRKQEPLSAAARRLLASIREACTRSPLREAAASG